MDELLFDWDRANVGHIRKRQISREQVEQALRDPNGADAFSYNQGGEYRKAIIGMTGNGKLRHVVYTERNGQIRPIHVRGAYEHEAREYFGR